MIAKVCNANMSITVVVNDYETSLQRSSMEAASGRLGVPSGSNFNSEQTDVMSKGHQAHGHVNKRDVQASDTVQWLMK